MIKPSLCLKYYSKRSVQEEIVRLSQDRELIGRYLNGGFDKRPQVLLNERDIFLQTRKGISSFHASVEKWNNPMFLNHELKEDEIKNNRKGWDLLIDIDCKNVEESKKVAISIIKILKKNKINDPSIKYSGNKGFHIGISGETLPNNEKLDNVMVKDLFPQGVRIVSEYLLDEVKKDLSEEKEILKQEFIDSILISSRHLFRTSYSLHEKTGLSSVVINKDEIEGFGKEMAEPLKVEVKPFLITKDSSKYLFERAYYFFSRKEEEKEILEEEQEEQKKQIGLKDGTKSSFKIIDKPILEELFPPCMKNILKGLIDGRKRSVFVLINFLRLNGYSLSEIEKKLKEWNEKNEQPLKWGYIKSQLNYQKRINKPLPPPNCMKYYEDLNICKPDNLCKRIKNPVNYSLIKNK